MPVPYSAQFLKFLDWTAKRYLPHFSRVFLDQESGEVKERVLGCGTKTADTLSTSLEQSDGVGGTTHLTHQFELSKNPRKRYLGQFSRVFLDQESGEVTGPRRTCVAHPADAISTRLAQRHLLRGTTHLTHSKILNRSDASPSLSLSLSVSVSLSFFLSLSRARALSFSLYLRPHLVLMSSASSVWRFHFGGIVRFPLDARQLGFIGYCADIGDSAAFSLE